MFEHPKQIRHFRHVNSMKHSCHRPFPRKAALATLPAATGQLDLGLVRSGQRMAGPGGRIPPWATHGKSAWRSCKLRTRLRVWLGLLRMIS